MALDRSQRKVINALIERPQTIRQLAITLGASESYLRIQLKMLEKGKEVTLDKERQPYVYSVPDTSPELRLRRALDDAKRILKAETLPENSDPIYKRIRNSKKEAWIDFAEFFEVMAQAIRELEADGELIDTLETR